MIARASGKRRSGLSYNGSIRSAPAVGAKTAAVRAGVGGRNQDRRRIASIAARACATASSSSASASAGSSPLRTAASRDSAASATRNAPIARADPFNVCASAPASAGRVRQVPIRPHRLGREHRQHLALEAGIAQRHPVEMADIDRTVIGSERRRWHPVNPFQMKRHGGKSESSSAAPARRFRQPIMELVNGTFRAARRKFALFLAESCPN